MLEGRNWTGENGATSDDLARLRLAAPENLPQRYLDLLAFSDGGEGPLPVSPYNFCLDSVTTVTATIASSNHGQADLDGFLIIGGDGGGEYIAFDLRSGRPWPVVSIDMVAGGDSAALIAADFNAFLDQIGRE
ncbi:SMI1/KNR4 family protein [Shinella sp. M31]|uniref:SMI1/KNR4 family protein n=1 Tax=Shinella sp. M31 TaxID=3368615 RepID=UPI003B9FE336